MRVWFTDFWKGFDVRDNFFVSVLNDCGLSYTISRWSPDLLFFSCFGSAHKRFSCRKIIYIGENRRPNFDECDFAISFDYLNDARHLRLPLYILEAWHQAKLRGLKRGIDDVLAILTTTPPEDVLVRKEHFCSFIFRKGNVERRNLFFDRLSKYRRVASAGPWLNNTGYTVRDKIDYLRHCKFNIAFENSIYPGYTTEKLFDPLLAHCIPIYWGNPLVGRDFDPKSFINVSRFENDELAIEAIIALDKDDDLYIKHVRQARFPGNVPTVYWDMRRIQNFLLAAIEGVTILD